ncbi:MAG: NAD(P)/FAD-dependent oxidoreductase [Rhizobiaceae bacterium]|nr:NAD(P)/FAD-dependent oxidoreductase [Rhizobiaceae bacterium]
MTDYDVAILGGGLAGSICAAMLHKQGISHVLVDPREEYPNEFRCEKFNRQQIELLIETGLAEPVFKELTPVKDVWMARFGRLVRKQHYPHYGFSYNEAVNAVRRIHVPKENFLLNTVKSVKNSADGQMVELTDGSSINTKLVVLATGANTGLQRDIGMHQEMLSERHCLAIGFNLEPKSEFEFDTMTYWPENSYGKMSYLTFFRTSGGWRANLFGYWNSKDPLVRKLMTEPVNALVEMMPSLRNVIGDFSISEKLRIRPINLYQWKAGTSDGVVSIGDAWSSSCPGAGTGTTKAINDALQLSNRFIPQWLEDKHFDVETISAFYHDKKKTEIDQASLREAYRLRSMTLDNTPYWKAQRLLRFAYHSMRGKLSNA